MKAFAFGLGTLAYLLLAYFIWLQILLQCGLGPDSPVACNDKADRQSFSFVVGAVLFYLILSVGIWWPRGKNAK